MRKSIILLVLIFVCNVIGYIPAKAEEEDAVRAIVKERLAFTVEELGWTDEDVNAYMDQYDDYKAFAADLVEYRMYMDCGGEYMEFDEFKEKRPAAIRTAEPRQENETLQLTPQAPLSGLGEVDPDGVLTPERELKDNRRYSMIRDTERIDPTSGEMSYTETDLYLPGVNGLDFKLVSRYDQDENATGAGHPVPVDENYWNTWVWAYKSDAEDRYGIGAG